MDDSLDSALLADLDFLLGLGSDDGLLDLDCLEPCENLAYTSHEAGSCAAGSCPALFQPLVRAQKRGAANEEEVVSDSGGSAEKKRQR